MGAVAQGTRRHTGVRHLANLTTETEARRTLGTDCGYLLWPFLVGAFLEKKIDYKAMAFRHFFPIHLK